MIEIEFNFDVSGFIHTLLELRAKVKAKSPQAVLDAVEALREDAINVPPKCPKRFGGLIEAHEVYLENPSPGEIAGVLLVRKPFARALHEGVCGPNLVPVRNWTEPGSGPKWIESKMIRFKNKYIKIAAEEI